jgi:hypothetical protein
MRESSIPFLGVVGAATYGAGFFTGAPAGAALGYGLGLRVKGRLSRRKKNKNLVGAEDKGLQKRALGVA